MVATNKSKAAERQWAVKGFAFATDLMENKSLKAALTRTYPHSGGKTNPRTRIQCSVTHLFRYMYFFRRFYGNKSARLIQAAVEDLKLEDSYVWAQIFNLYSAARQACTNNGYIAPDAPLTDQIMCAAVDRVLSLIPVDHDMTDEDKKELDGLRKKWKSITGEWKKKGNAAEPYLPNGDVLLMQLLEPPVPLEDVAMEDAPDLVTDAGTVAVEQNPQTDSLDDPDAYQRFADTFDLIKSDPQQAVKRLESAYLHPMVHPDIKVICWDLGKATHDKIQADQLANQNFATIADALAQKIWGS